MDTAIAASLGLLVLIAISCIMINVYMLLTKQIRNPHDMLESARHGNRLARVYVGLFFVAVAILLVLVALLALRA